MTTPNPELLYRYRYDPLDRLASCLPLGQDVTVVWLPATAAVQTQQMYRFY